jgi:hypothetical protein
MAAHPLMHHRLQDGRVPTCMMEITTVVGCKVNCTYCPQKSLLSQYRSPKRRLAFDDFRLALDKMPEDVIIIFAGFAEPFLNEDCTRMILHAHGKGHPLCVFTTAVGMTLEDVEQIRAIPFSAFPHGGFTIHLPDARRLAKIDVTPEYLQVLEALKAANIQNFSVMAMDAVHPDVAPIFPPSSVRRPTMNSRSGNLVHEGVTEDFVASSHDGPVICGRDEGIYNNVMLPNGDVVLCCQDYRMDHVLGNIFEQSFDDVLPRPLPGYELCRTCVYAIKPPQTSPVVAFGQAPA